MHSSRFSGIGFGREEGVELLRQSCRRVLSGSPMRMKTRLIGPQQFQLLPLGQRAEIEPIERGQQLRLQRLVALPGQGHGAGDQRLGVLLGQDAVLPELAGSGAPAPRGRHSE